MNRKFHINRLFQILYPLLVYFSIYQAMDFLFLLLIGSIVGPLTCLMLSAAVTLIPIYHIYRQAPIVKAEKWFCKEDLLTDILGIFFVIFLGVGLNVLVSTFSLLPESAGYENATKVLYSGGIVVKILCNVIFVPILEELLYRGIIAGQLEVIYKNKNIAIIVSAVLFGILHFNVVQFIYACICGFALAYIYLRNHKIWVPIAAHGLTNFIVVMYTTFN
ncbi:MAG: CPBP family intramembrane metalloprotease [Lachnospiraceae bacterium]|nr:CPBP family intramembrane metalloprotease [Lachnospiraceae bacterium]